MDAHYDEQQRQQDEDGYDPYMDEDDGARDHDRIGDMGMEVEVEETFDPRHDDYEDYDYELMGESDSPMQSVQHAVVGALKYWLLFYVVLTHCFVVWKWDSYYQPSAQQDDGNETAAAAAAAVEGADSGETQLMIDPYERHREAIESILGELQRYDQQQQDTLEQVQQQRDQLHAYEASINEFVTETEAAAAASMISPARDISLRSFLHTMRQTSLDDLMQGDFTSASKELQELIEDPASYEMEDEAPSIDWKYVGAVFEEFTQSEEDEQPPIVREFRSSDGECPVPKNELHRLQRKLERLQRHPTAVGVDGGDATVDGQVQPVRRGPIIPPDAATKQDLEDFIRAIRSKIQQRPRSSTLQDLVLPDTFEKYEAELDRQLDAVENRFNDEIKSMTVRVTEEMENEQQEFFALAEAQQRQQQLQQQQQQQQNDYVVDVDRCFTEDQLAEMVFRGINAIHRNQDLRDILEDHALALWAESASGDEEEPRIILDADLPLPIPDVLQKDGTATPKTANLRHVLDTELLQRSKEWMDQLVELVGGYNDSVDQMLDSIAPGDQRVGQVVVDSILQRAGEFNVPTIASIADAIPAKLKQK